MPVLLGLATAATAHAPAPASRQAAAADLAASPIDAGSKWEISAQPYIWTASFKGDFAVRPDTEPVGLDLTFGDIFRHLKFVAMGVIEARHERVILMGDLVWANVGAEKSLSIRDRDFLSGSLASKTLIVTALGGYRVIPTAPLTVDLFAGGRLLGASMRLKLNGPTRSVDDTVTKTWVDPIIATRLTADVAPKVSVSLYGDLGGFGVSSRVTWQAWGLVKYELSRKAALTVGWRHYVVDYRKGSFLYDAHADGPIIGAVFGF